MATIYKDLETWQAGMSLVTACYAATKTFPRDELFCTRTGQLLNGLYRSIELRVGG
jgi:hypothetical protein